MKKITLLLLLFFISLFWRGGEAIAQKQGQARVDSLLARLPGAAEDTNKVKLLAYISYSYQSINPDEGMKYAEQAFALTGKLNWKKGLALAYEVTGINYFCKSDYKKALDCYEKALAIAKELDDKFGIAEITGHFGVVYTEESIFSMALEYDKKALNLYEELGDKNGKAYVIWDKGNMYAYQNDFPTALENLNLSLQLYKELNNKEGEANNLNDLGYVYYMKDYLTGSTEYFSQSLQYYTKALEIDQKYGFKRGISRNLLGIGINYGDGKNDYVKAIDYSLKSLKIADEISYNRVIVWNLGNIGEYYLDIAKDTTSRMYPDSLKNKKTVLSEASTYLNKAIELAIEKQGEANAIGYYYQDLSEVQKQAGNYKEALESYIHHAFYNDYAHSLESMRKIAGIENKDSLELKQKEVALAEVESKRQKLFKNVSISGFAVMLLFAGVFFTQRNRISKGKKRSDELLLNILPAETAEELKQTGTAKARSYELVTVMFTDFKNFTQASEKMTAEELVNEINNCYSKFDKITTRHGIEKIKTIGDSYMCAGGLPVENKTNPVEVVNAALDILKFIEKEKRERQNNNQPYFEIRIGIHTGPVVAGIVGIKKFAYDIWGDTVNIASRMESSGAVGKVNISGTTYELVKDKFTCSHRGKVDAKNKGMIDMYFVEGDKS